MFNKIGMINTFYVTMLLKIVVYVPKYNMWKEDFYIIVLLKILIYVYNIVHIVDNILNE